MHSSLRRGGPGVAVAVAAFAALPGPVSADEPVRCAEQLATIVGSPGSESIVGTSGRDAILALGGNDSVPIVSELGMKLRDFQLSVATGQP
jgi:hypothetical protein